ncbi:MAG TPA: hypothetical protein PLK76_03065 [bacterium]|nr:hypothetical protein [bacterium]
MQSEIKFSLELEVELVKKYLSKKRWFDKNGYNCVLPEKIEIGDSEEIIKEKTNREYNKNDYKIMAEKIKMYFEKYASLMEKNLIIVFDKQVLQNIEIILTKYGPGGSYNLPNKIIFSINNSKGAKIIWHELVHILLEPDILKYKIEHNVKERIVDLILNSKKFDFLNYNFWQDNYGGTEKYIDDLFERYFFNDREKFFEKIKSHLLHRR